MKKWIFFLWIIMIWMFSISGTSLAAEVPDRNREGSISITMKDGDRIVTDGSLTLYQAGELVWDGEAYAYQLTESFADSQISLESVTSPALPGKLEAYAKQTQVTGITQGVTAQGTVVFSQLEPGLYLIVQCRPAKGYESIHSFLVTLPLPADGKLIYEVDATPKMSLKRKEETTPETIPNQPAGSHEVETGDEAEPGTWLAVAGVSVVALGILLVAHLEEKRFQKRRKR